MTTKSTKPAPVQTTEVQSPSPIASGHVPSEAELVAAAKQFELAPAATNDAAAKAALGKFIVEVNASNLDTLGGPAVVAALWGGTLLGCTIVNGTARVEVGPAAG